MRILILGGDGMLGHRLLRHLEPRHQVTVTLRRPLAAYREHGLFTAANSIAGVDARDWPAVEAALTAVSPAAVVNCIGIVKQRDEAKAPIPSIEINSLLPHRLLGACRAAGRRLIHLSTDCVFSGRRGAYREDDVPDPVDLYGRSKLLGELDAPPALTLRTSIIGLELTRKSGLVEWFLSQRGTVRGFRRAIYSGLTTQEAARVIERLLADHPQLVGVWQVASQPISKYDLLASLARHLDRRDVEILPDDDFACDRSLDGSRFAAATGYRPPTWDAMLEELAVEVRQRRKGPDGAP
jgi:dTDP-4-dehydrorhamnose reductase